MYYIQITICTSQYAQVTGILAHVTYKLQFVHHSTPNLLAY